METPTFIESYQTEEYDFCDKVIHALEDIFTNQYAGMTEEEKRNKGFMVGSETNKGQARRTDFSVDFRSIEHPLNVDMHNLLAKYVERYANKYVGFSNQSSFSQHMKVQKTPPKGGFHIWHCEHGSNRNDSYRTLTWTLYLNDIPDGEGETEFLEYGVKVQPKKGLLCLFPAAWTHIHRGNPVYTTTKYIATGWYYLT
jgi:hypothetical protein